MPLLAAAFACLAVAEQDHEPPFSIFELIPTPPLSIVDAQNRLSRSIDRTDAGLKEVFSDKLNDRAAERLKSWLQVLEDRDLIRGIPSRDSLTEPQRKSLAELAGLARALPRDVKALSEKFDKRIEARRAEVEGRISRARVETLPAIEHACRLVSDEIDNPVECREFKRQRSEKIALQKHALLKTADEAFKDYRAESSRLFQRCADALLRAKVAFRDALPPDAREAIRKIERSEVQLLRDLMAVNDGLVISTAKP
ncbi:MAG: hypothetical protein HY075_06485 [Deltaproteobacteria bacterium]|nr:hypothetical protein [Deltaproteobacteria bacterium]